MPERTFQSLPLARQQLIQVMQQYPFCRIENLSVLDGQPFFKQNTKVFAERKLGTSDSPKQAKSAEFTLKKEYLDLLQQLDAIKNGVIQTLEVRSGLPFRMIREISI